MSCRGLLQLTDHNWGGAEVTGAGEGVGGAGRIIIWINDDSPADVVTCHIDKTHES